MQNYQKNNILRGILVVLLISGCGTKVNVPDVSHIPITVTIERFDNQFFFIDTNNVAAGLKLLEPNYPEFLPTYIQDIMNFGPLADTNRFLEPQVHQFLTNKDFRALQDSVDVHFADIRPLEAELTQAFRLTKYYLPSFHEPKRVITFISAIGNYAAITVDSILGIGLDMHMGADFPIYAMLPDYPDYIVRRFTPENITPNVMKVLYQNYFPLQDKNVKLIERFIELGRQQYFLEKVLPEVTEDIRLGYTKEQLKYCKENEQMIWQYFVQNKLLYTTDWQDIVRYTGEGPSTQGLPAEVPGQIGSFTGYRIVKKFMEKHPDVTLEQLLSTKDVMSILNEAKYRP